MQPLTKEDSVLNLCMIKESSTAINQLPKDVMVKIFSLLEIKDVMRCSEVNKQWKEYTNQDQLWKVLCERDFAYSRLDSKTFAENATSWKKTYQTIKINSLLYASVDIGDIDPSVLSFAIQLNGWTISFEKSRKISSPKSKANINSNNNNGYRLR